MAEYLLELLSEEIPARMQAQAARDLDRLARAGLEDADLSFASLETFCGPRRLTLWVDGLPLRQADRTLERRGPKLGAPAAALEGFLRSTGLQREALLERDGAYWAVTARPGRTTREVLPEIVAEILPAFPWPKSMRSGRSGFRWVRPLRRILSVFDGAPAPLVIEDLSSGVETEGHRFMGAKGPVAALSFSAYEAELRARFVELRRERRLEMIEEGARALCVEAGLALVEDQGLLEEVAGLAEWPTPLLGVMDPAFLELPPEVVRTSMRTHQKYFAVRERQGDALAPRFIVVANISAGTSELIAAGNAKVLAARLSDARFFWREDGRIALEDRLQRLEGVTFHAALGTMRQRVERLEAAAAALAAHLGARQEEARLAARLAKCDLVTGMVGEFPELQGVMGGYYARAEGRRALAGPLAGRGAWSAATDEAAVDAVADAIRDQYRPQGPSDALPEGRLGRVLALADKLDLLIGFFAVGEKPTGSRDPFALRRAALGAVRILLAEPAGVDVDRLLAAVAAADERQSAVRTQAALEVKAFMLERLKGLLKEEGGRHDVLDAVFAAGVADLAGVGARAKALSAFIDGEAGASLLAGYRRAANILRAGARKGGSEPEPPAIASDGGEGPAAETGLETALLGVEDGLRAALARADHARALELLSQLRAPVDLFFEKVLVNDSDPEIRRRRLSLLSRVRDAANGVADFSLISG